MNRENMLSKNIKSMRKEKGITQAQLAKLTGLSMSAIRSYENGLREPNSKAMAALESFFHVTGEYLRGADENPEPEYIHKDRDERTSPFYGFDIGNLGEDPVLIVEKRIGDETYIRDMFRGEQAVRLEKIIEGDKDMAYKMMLNKEKFMKTEFGCEMEEVIQAWDKALGDKYRADVDFHTLQTLAWCQAQWEVYKLAMKQFYGIEYNFTRTDEYFGVCTDDEDFLFKIYRKPLSDKITASGQGTNTTVYYERHCVTRKGIKVDGVEYWNNDLTSLHIGENVVVEVNPTTIRVFDTPGHVCCEFNRLTSKGKTCPAHLY